MGPDVAEVTAGGRLASSACDRNHSGDTFAPMNALPGFARMILVAATVVVLAASASSKSSAPPPIVGAWNAAPPTSQPMNDSAAAGLWKTTFGAVKIEGDGVGRVHGAWVYDRNGQQVVGYFGGALDGNVLRLTWREPAQPQPGEVQLGGEGWLVFDPAGASFSGRWWTSSRDRQGDWSGTRGAPAPGPAAMAPAGLAGASYGGASYGDYDSEGISGGR